MPKKIMKLIILLHISFFIEVASLKIPCSQKIVQGELYGSQCSKTEFVQNVDYKYLDNYIDINNDK